MSSAEPSPEPTTPLQWAVRWHAVVLAALLFGSVPLVHLVWHGLLGRDEPLLRTRSQLPAPTATAASIADGSWMLAKERQLREDSPIVWWLRGQWNELRYHAGAPRSTQVHFGKDEWWFIAPSVAPDRAAFERARPQRLQFLRDVRALVEQAGAKLFVMIEPDKARVYPDKCYADGQLPPGKRDAYAAILADFAAAGIPTADLAAAMSAARAADPTVELYFRRDTHWRPQGALVGGQAAAAALEAVYGPLLGPRRAIELGNVTEMRLLGDLPANVGFLTLEVTDTWAGGGRTLPLSLLADRLAEVRGYYAIRERTAAGTVALDGKDPNAEILVIGTSFSEENGANALSLALGRPVRTVIVRGAAGMKPLRAALAELRRGTKAKVVVWEMVERGFFEDVWLAPEALR